MSNGCNRRRGECRVHPADRDHATATDIEDVAVGPGADEDQPERCEDCSRDVHRRCDPTRALRRTGHRTISVQPDALPLPASLGYLSEVSHPVDAVEQCVAAATIERAVDRHVCHAPHPERRQCCRAWKVGDSKLERFVALGHEAAVAVDHRRPVPQREVHVLGVENVVVRDGKLREHDVARSRQGAVDRRWIRPDGTERKNGPDVDDARDHGGTKSQRGGPCPAHRCEQPANAESSQHGQAQSHQNAEPRGHAQPSDWRKPAVEIADRSGR